eukprot:1898276-Prorocentrum_lima.AAC.1
MESIRDGLNLQEPGRHIRLHLLDEFPPFAHWVSEAIESIPSVLIVVACPVQLVGTNTSELGDGFHVRRQSQCSSDCFK